MCSIPPSWITQPSSSYHSSSIRVAKINSIISDCIVSEHITADSVTILLPPTNPTDAVTKDYVDNKLVFYWKNPALVATTGQQTLSGNPVTIDGYPVVNGSRVLVHLQTNEVENGIYTVNTSGAWPRASDLPTGSHSSGAALWILEGSQYIHTTFVCDDLPSADIVGTDPLSFVQFSGGTGAIVPGVALTLTGNLLDVNVNSVNIGVDGLNTLELIDTTVTAGPYGSATQVPSFTVDSKGRLTAAANISITGTSPVGSTLPNTNIWVGNVSNQAAAVAMSGDATIVNTGALTLANTTVTAGPYGSSTQVPSFTVDSKGRLTAAANITITSPIISSIYSTLVPVTINALPHSLTASELLSTYIIISALATGNHDLTLPSANSLYNQIGPSNFTNNMSFKFSVLKLSINTTTIVLDPSITTLANTLTLSQNDISNFILILNTSTTANSFINIIHNINI